VQINLKANTKEREALAYRMGIESIQNLKASISIVNTKVGCFRVTGIIDSELIQVDSASGDKQEFSINDTFEEIFAFQETLDSEETNTFEKQFEVEAIENSILDLGEIVTQNLSLALEPLFANSQGFYSENAVFSAGRDDLDVESRPFDVLKDLKMK
jgi:uncharacterized metal-binding protein YceD (DUF177 family)